MQGQRIIDRYYQKIERGILSGDLKFTNISNYNGLMEEFKINEITYNISILTKYCSKGGTINNDPNSNYQRVDMVVWCKGSNNNVLWIGTNNNPISRLYAKMGL